MSFIKALFEKKSSIKRFNHADLHDAVRYGDVKDVKAHIKAGNDLDERGHKSETPLHLAAGVATYIVGEKGEKRRNNSKTASLLIKAGADVTVPGPVNGRTALHGFAEFDDVKVASMRIDHGADVDARDVDGRTPLHMAARWGNIKVAKLLLKKGADVDAKVMDGSTALRLAKMNNHDKLAKLLVDHGAS